MMAYQVGELRQDRLEQAYPLVQLHHGALSLQDWKQFASRWLSDVAPLIEQGLLCCEDDDGTILGIAHYRIDQDLAVGLQLEADHILCFGRFPRDWCSVLNSLILALENRALSAGCGAVNLWFTADAPKFYPSKAFDQQRERGHRFSRWCYGKQLASRQPDA